MANITFKVNIDADLYRVLDKILDNKTKLAIHNLFAKMNNDYVPFLEGPLSQTVQVFPDYIKYIQPYANYQYNGVNFNFTKDFHPKATHHWDKAMLLEKGDSFTSQVNAILRRRAEDIYGG